MTMEHFRAGKIQIFTQNLSFLPILPQMELFQSHPRHLGPLYCTPSLLPKKAILTKAANLLETLKNSLI
jgi:hypothetical protein